MIKRLEPALGPSLRSLDRFAAESLDRLEMYVPGFKAGGEAAMMRVDDDAAFEAAEQGGQGEPRQPPLSPGLTHPDLAATTQPLIQRKPKSTWSTIVSNVGGYVISEDAMRGLRYCLRWLQVGSLRSGVWSPRHAP